MQQGTERKNQIVRAAHIARDLSHLPGAATPDWCQRAAETFTRHDPSTRAWVIVVEPKGTRLDRQTESTGFAAGATARTERTPPERLALAFIRSVLKTLPDLDLPGVVSGDQLLKLLQHPFRGIVHLRRHAHMLVGVAEVEPGVELPPDPASVPRLLLIFWDRPPERPHSRRTKRDTAGLKSGARRGCVAPEDLRLILGSVLSVAQDRLRQALGNGETDNPWLSVCEQRVLDMLTTGMSVPQIAKTQGRSPHTVHDHVKRLYAKLGANSRGELLARVLGNTPRVPLPTPVVRRQRPMLAFRTSAYVDHRGW